MRLAPLVIEELSGAHDRDGFSCGSSALDQYIQRQASQDVRHRVAKVFVAIGDRPSEIAGFYTLSAGGVARDDLPEEMARRLPRHPIPVALIGRLAVGLDHQGTGLGKLLLADALKRVVRASAEIAVHAVVVDAKDGAARSFYERFGFILLPSSERRLFLPVATIAQLEI